MIRTHEGGTKAGKSYRAGGPRGDGHVLSLLIIGVLVGAGLGLRFKLIVLVPAIGFACAVIAAYGLEHGNGGWWLVLAMIIITISIQVGYLVGFILRSLTRVVGAFLFRVFRFAKRPRD
jgi:hypothetical protein